MRLLLPRFEVLIDTQKKKQLYSEEVTCYFLPVGGRWYLFYSAPVFDAHRKASPVCSAFEQQLTLHVKFPRQRTVP